MKQYISVCSEEPQAENSGDLYQNTSAFRKRLQTCEKFFGGTELENGFKNFCNITGADPAKNLTEFQAKARDFQIFYALIVVHKTSLLFTFMHFGTIEGGGGRYYLLTKSRFLISFRQKTVPL